MSLVKLQEEFTLAIAQLINYAYARGWTLTVGDFYRSPRAFGHMGKKGVYGSRNSCHKMRLAGDLNLRVDGKLLEDGDHWAWKELGEEWEKMHPQARSGIRFNDANHFSFEYNGFK